MRTIILAALLGAVLGGLLAAIVGADFNGSLAAAGDRQRHALEGAALWALPGLALGGLLGAAIGWFISARRRLHSVKARSRRH